ncbi:hypothetical protein [Micromonospora wenchangensis]|uniref:hypothetical protein n=1 Tax=Micromonospora wenchangensis TaxID=1185415 RepID=UPI0038121E1F
MNELVSVGFGAAVTLTAVAVQHLLVQRQQRTARLHESKITLYGDVYTDLAATEQALANATTDYSPSAGAQIPDRASTGGRLHLLAPPAVVEAWTRYLRAAESLFVYERESGIRYDLGQTMPADHELVSEARAAIADVRRTVQADLR